jgi:hypothetical protein
VAHRVVTWTEVATLLSCADLADAHEALDHLLGLTVEGDDADDP